MSSSRHLTHKLQEFLKMQRRVEKAPGFSSALLEYQSLFSSSSSSDAAVTVDPNTCNVTLRYPVTRNRLLPNNDVVSLSTYLAVIDDVTMWALVLGDKERSRPGKSVSLSLWSNGNIDNIGQRIGDEVDITTSIQKIGRNLGFCGAQVRDVASGKLVCAASHVKYLPLNPLYDMALSSYGWKAATLYSDYILSDPAPSDAILADLFDSLSFVSDGTATFEVEPIHASLGGPIHGGCQAVLMEMVATTVAQQQLDCSQVSLESTHIEYMSPPNSRTVELQTQVLALPSGDDDTITLLVKLVGDGRIKSEGVLCFTKAVPA